MVDWSVAATTAVVCVGCAFLAEAGRRQLRDDAAAEQAKANREAQAREDAFITFVLNNPNYRPCSQLSAPSPWRSSQLRTDPLAFGARVHPPLQDDLHTLRDNNLRGLDGIHADDLSNAELLDIIVAATNASESQRERESER